MSFDDELGAGVDPQAPVVCASLAKRRAALWAEWYSVLESYAARIDAASVVDAAQVAREDRGLRAPWAMRDESFFDAVIRGEYTGKAGA